jgi:hypothetical protein
MLCNEYFFPALAISAFPQDITRLEILPMLRRGHEV